MSPLSGAVILVGLFYAIYAVPADIADDDYIPLPDYGPGAYNREPSTKTGDLVAAWNPSMKMNPEELGDYLEGDMMLPPPSMTRSGMISRTLRWPNATIPIVVGGNFSNFELTTIVQTLFREFGESETCVSFVDRTTERDYVRLTNAPTGCWSYVGRIGGRQDLNLQTPGCLTYNGTIIHEFLHAFGVVHEHSSPERDNYIVINLNNVQRGAERNFAKYSATQVSSFGSQYDYGSVMHYSTHAFSKNGYPTIVPMTCGVPMGQRDHLSTSDVATIKAMYPCP